MIPEQPHVARRSASHGALSSSYAIQARISSESGHLLPPFRPLRSIREHTHTYLDPAASVEGMLRKTTETSNIGIFSIGRSNGLRSRPSLSDLRQPSQSFSRISARLPVQDDRKQLPSYRDSTSEIISMYGSENQSSKSVSGTLSPPWDDSGQRSYSMTTCGSRGYFTPLVNGIQPVSDFHLKGQRPRSPYPYPTRLARPGIRPSSPALTENGLVDYSRMVEIDRIPQRTTHHPHKTLFPHQTTRNPPPLSLRYGVNQSTQCLLDDSGLCRPFITSSSRRPSLPNHLQPWNLRPRGGPEGDPLDQSLRTMSLTSMRDRCSPAPLGVSGLPNTPKKPLFYDYSEDFENVVESPPMCPVAPTPKRVSSTYCPLIVEDNCDANADDTNDTGKAAGDAVTYLQRATLIKRVDDDDDHGIEQYRPMSPASQRSSSTQPALPDFEGIAYALSPVLTPLDQIVKYSHLPDATLDEQQDFAKNTPKTAGDTTEAAAATAMPSRDSIFDSPLQPKTPGLDIKVSPPEPLDNREEDCSSLDQHEHDTEKDICFVGLDEKQAGPSNMPSSTPSPYLSSGPSMLPSRYSDFRKDSRLFSLSSNLSDLASFVKYIDRHIQSPDPEDVEQDNSSALPPSRTAPDQSREHIQDHNRKMTPEHPRKPSLCTLGRYPAGRKMNIGVPVDDELEQFQVVSTRSGPTLVPQPISPAKMLRVKNSIPQLMKALPPLPGYSPAPESPFGPAVVPIDFEPFEISRLTDARSTLTETILTKKCGDAEDVPKGYDPFVFDRGVRKPRFKLKHAASFAPGNPGELRRGYLKQSDRAHQHSEKRPSTAGEYSTGAVKRRLPIKLSRPTLTLLESEDTGTMRRCPGPSKSSTVSELASKEPIDLFSDWERSLERPVPEPIIDIPQEQFHGQKLVVKASRLNASDNVRGPSLDARIDTLCFATTGSDLVSDVETQSFFSDNNIITLRRGLRRKFSFLRARLIEPRHRQGSPLRNVSRNDHDDVKGFQLPSTEVHSTNTFTGLISGAGQLRDEHTAVSTPKVRSKLERFMKGAKERIRAWGRPKRRTV